MQLGELGEQIVLKSEKAFRQIRYQGFEVAWADMYYHRKTKRDLEARRAYTRDKSGPSSREEKFYLRYP